VTFYLGQLVFSQIRDQAKNDAEERKRICMSESSPGTLLLAEVLGHALHVKARVTKIGIVDHVMELERILTHQKNVMHVKVPVSIYTQERIVLNVMAQE
jgi:hypothetical protein